MERFNVTRSSYTLTSLHVTLSRDFSPERHPAVRHIHVKTKIMVQSRCNSHTGKEMKIRGDITEVVDEFVYLGTCITKCRDEPKDMR